MNTDPKSVRDGPAEEVMVMEKGLEKSALFVIILHQETCNIHYF